MATGKMILSVALLSAALCVLHAAEPDLEKDYKHEPLSDAVAAEADDPTP